MSNKNFKIQGLDGLRAIAALAVLGYHIFNQALNSGFLGVDLFFVLSGFLITSLLINEFEQTDTLDLKQFWLKRFRRLFPAIAFCIIICVPVCFFLNKDLLVNIKSEILGALTFTYNWVQIFSHHDYFDRLNEQFLQNVWTLSLEEQFYVIWPLLLLILLKTRFFKIILPLLLATGSIWLMWYLGEIGTDKTRIYEGSDTHSFGLMLGAVLALAYPDAFVTGEKNESKKIFGKEIGIMLERNIMFLRAIYGWVSFIGIFVLFGLDINFKFIYPWGILLMSIFGIGIIQACFWDINYLTGNNLVKILELPLLVWLGKRSYALYLWHWPICLLVNNMLPANYDIINALIATALSIFFAAISYSLIEEPMRKNGILNTLKSYTPTSLGEKPSLVLPTIMIIIALIPTIFAVFFSPKETSVAKQVKEEARILNIIQDETNTKKENVQIIYTVKRLEDEKSELKNLNDKASEVKGKNITFKVVRYEDAMARNEINSENNQTETIIVTSDEIFGLHNGIKSDEIVIVGDSVTLSAATLIKANLPNTLIDAEISRSAESGLETVKKLKEDGLLTKYLVFSLGTNGIFTTNQAHELLEIVNYDTKIIFVTAHGPASKKWISGSNDTMREFAELYPDRIKIAQWEAAVSKEPNAFHSDNIHPNKKGATIYIQTIMQTLNEF